MSDRPKSCPFCGGEPRIKIAQNLDGKYGIGCSREMCIMFLPDDVDLNRLHHYVWVWSNEKDMVKAWNKRA